MATEPTGPLCGVFEETASFAMSTRSCSPKNTSRPSHPAAQLFCRTKEENGVGGSCMVNSGRRDLHVDVTGCLQTEAPAVASPSRRLPCSGRTPSRECTCACTDQDVTISFVCAKRSVRRPLLGIPDTGSGGWGSTDEKTLAGLGLICE